MATKKHIHPFWLAAAAPVALTACLSDPSMSQEAEPLRPGVEVPTADVTRAVDDSSAPESEPIGEEPGTVRWMQRVGGVADDSLGGMSIGGTGELLLTGGFHHWVDFGADGLYAPAGDDVFAAAFHGDGSNVWARQLSGLSDERGASIAGTPDGGYVVTGMFGSDINLGDGSHQSRGGTDVFVARYDASGAHRWSDTWGGAGDDRAAVLGTDDYGRPVIAGTFEGTANIAGTELQSSGGRDLFVAHFDPAGGMQVHKLGNAGDDSVGGLAVAPNGAFVVIGNAPTLDTELSEPGQKPQGPSDVFVAAFDRSGEHLWSSRIGGAGEDVAAAAAIDARGIVAVALTFEGSIEFAGETHTSVGGTDAMVAVLDSQGNEHWARTVGSANDDRASGLAVDPARGLILSGTFAGTTIAADATRTAAKLETRGGSDAFATSYTVEGELAWAVSAGSAGNDDVAGVVVDYDGNAVIAGTFTDEITTDGAAVTTNGGRDVFVLSIAQ